MNGRIQVRIDRDLEDIVPVFLANREKDLPLIATLLAEEDYDALRVLGHRLKGAGGGWHMLRTHKDIFSSWKWRRLWPVYLEQVISNLWSFSFVTVSFIWIITYLLPGNPLGFSVIPVWYGGIISLACMAQFGAALFVNRRYDSSLWKMFFWVPWYPIFYFCFSALAVVYTSYKGLFGKLDHVGKWTSPKRENRNPGRT